VPMSLPETNNLISLLGAIYSTSMYVLQVLLRIHCNVTNTEDDDMFFF
jgi:hypothetical protein